jgi:hypothetical protein
VQQLRFLNFWISSTFTYFYAIREHNISGTRPVLILGCGAGMYLRTGKDPVPEILYALIA